MSSSTFQDYSCLIKAIEKKDLKFFFILKICHEQ